MQSGWLSLVIFDAQPKWLAATRFEWRQDQRAVSQNKIGCLLG
jgi:hypothetical protein